MARVATNRMGSSGDLEGRTLVQMLRHEDTCKGFTTRNVWRGPGGRAGGSWGSQGRPAGLAPGKKRREEGWVEASRPPGKAAGRPQAKVSSRATTCLRTGWWPWALGWTLALGTDAMTERLAD